MLRLSALVLNTDVLCEDGDCKCSESVTDKTTLARTPRGKFRAFRTLAYTSIVHFVYWTNTLRMWFCFINIGFSFGNVESQIHITVLLAATSISLSYTALMYKFSKVLANLPKKLCLIKRKYGLTKDWSLSRKSKASAVLISSNVLGLILGCIAPICLPFIQSFFHSILVVLVCPFEVEPESCWNIFFNVWFNLALLFSTAGTLSTVIIYHWFCNAVSYLFDQCSLELRNINSQETTPSRTLRKSVEFHRDICEWFSIGNDIFKYFVFGTYFLAVPSICFNMNIVFKVENTSGTLIFAIMIVLNMVTGLMMVVIPAIKSNAKVTQARREIFNLDLKQSTQEDLQLASFFGNKMLHPQAAITIADMLVINKGHLLTLLSMLVTYTVLIVQFQPLSTHPQGHMKNSNTTG